MTRDCLNQVTLNTLVHFVENFPSNVFILDIHLDWNQFYEHKEKEGLILYTMEDGKKRVHSPIGVPLI